MNSKLLVGMMRLAIVAGLLIVIAGGNTTAQVEESLSLNFDTLIIDYSKGNSVEILVTTPDRQKFLSDPINTLKRQGVMVPQAAEAHWLAFTVALRRLATSHRAKAKGSRRPSRGVEIWTYKFDKIAVLGTVAGDWNSDFTTTAGARKASASFLDNPLATLRAERVEVPTADERAWKQLADALKELRGVYSRIKARRNAEVSVNGGSGSDRIFNASNGSTAQLPDSGVPTSAGDPDRPVITGRTPNNEGNVPGGPGFDSVRSLGSLSFNFTQVELAREETLRVDLTNRLVLKRQEGDPPRVYALVKLYNSTGQVIAQSQKVSLPRNQVRPVTFNHSAIPLPNGPRTRRLQIRVAVEVEVQTTDRNTIYVNTAGGGVWASLKVIDNVTGKSTAGPSGQASDPRILYFGTGETNNEGGSGPDRMKVKGAPDQAVTGRVTGIAIDPGNSNAPVQGGFGNDQISSTGAHNNSTSGRPTNQRPRAALPDLVIKQFLFPPTNDKALRVQVSNDGSAAAGASRLIITVRKINGMAVGRQTHVNIPALAPGKKAWLLIDAKSILPVNVSLESTTFKLNADATGIVAESDETNNEVWHNL